MLVVLPVCSKDLHLALRNIEYILTLDGRSDFECLISYERGFEADTALLFDLCTRCFTKVNTFVYDKWQGEQAWPQPQNWTFQHTARWIEQQRKWPFFFWWEADCVPLKAGSLAAVASAHHAGQRPFSGPIANQLGMTYVAGVSVYPSEVSRYIPTALRARSTAWDIVASTHDGAIRNAHDISNLIEHVSSGSNTHFTNHADIARAIPETAVFFHKCKDGSLLDVLQNKVPTENSYPVTPATINTASFTEQQPQWESGYFTFPTASDTCYFNCSLVEYNGALQLVTRRERRHLERTTGGARTGNCNDIAIWEIRPNMTLKPAPIIPSIPVRYPDEQWEDPRAMLGADERVYLGCATWVHHKKWAIRQSFARLSRDLRRLEPLWETQHGGNTKKPIDHNTHEKNWIWFQHDGEWHCQYSINPGELFRVDAAGNVVQQWKGKDVRLPWEYGLPLRGGTPPVRVGNEYVAFFHSSVQWQKPKRRYHMGAYTFDAEPPFTLRRMTTRPLLTGSEDDFRSLGGPPCIFPNGALLRDDKWLIVFGVNDEACGWMKIPHNDLEQQLVEVNRKGIIEKAMEVFA